MKDAKILIVDDEIVLANNMSKLLSRRGYLVQVVYSGNEAIRTLTENSFDVMVLDLKMPGMDGIATMDAMKKLGLFSEVLVLTGHGSIDKVLDAVQMGAYDYVTKPCEIEELVSKVEAAFERKKTKDSENSIMA